MPFTLSIVLVPNKPWAGTVTKVNDDGTYDLDITPGNGFTLHETRVSVDDLRQTPHTCHADPSHKPENEFEEEEVE